MTDTDTGVGQFVIGTVSQLDDQKPGRVKVRLPHQGMCEGSWCSVIVPMGGPGRGMVFLPEPGDQVVVAFEQGDSDMGFILGAIWTDTQNPPELDGQPKKNNLRLIRSRSGHQLRFDDTPGKERVEVVDKDGTRKVVIDTSGKKIQVICEKGDVEITAGSGNIALKADQGELTLSAKTVSIQSKGKMDIKAEAVLTLNGKLVNIN